MRKVKYTDIDSNINNQASLDDVKDYLSVPAIDSVRDTATSSTTKGKSKKDKGPRHHVQTIGPESELQNRIRNTLSHGVIKEPTTNAKSINAIRHNRYYND